MSLLSDPEFAELRGRVAELETRLKSVEGRVGLASAPNIASIPTAPHFSPAPAPVAPPLSPASSSPDWPSTWTPFPQEKAPAFTPAPLPATEPRPSTPQSFPFSTPELPNNEPPKSLLDWENLIGGRLALWVGALCVFLALASLIVYVGQTLSPPSPAMRVAAGFAASIALFAGAFAARTRDQRRYSDGLLGSSLAVGYLSVWGGGPHFALWSLPVSLTGFSLYAALGVALAYRRDSQALLILGAIGGYLTPILVHHNNAPNLTFVFLNFLLVLNAGIVTVCVAKKWTEIIYGAFITTAFIMWGWSLEAHIETLRPLLWAFATLGWILFAGAACFRSFTYRENTKDGDLALLFSATGTYAATSQWLLAPLIQGFPGAFSLGLLLVFVALRYAATRRIPANTALRTSFMALACVAGALFVPLQFGQKGLVWGWLAQSVALAVVGRKTESNLLRNAGRTLWALALIAFVSDSLLHLPTGGALFDAFSLRFLFSLGATALLLFAVDSDDEQWSGAYSLFFAWGGVYWIGRAVTLCLSHSTLILPAQRTEATILVGASTIALWALGLWRLGWWRRQSARCFSAWLMLSGSLCFIAGVGLWGQAPLVALRIASFAIGALTIFALGHWHAKHEADNKAAAHETTAIAIASWLALDLTIEIAALWHSGTFALPALGETAWFVLCMAWTLFAAGAGALSIFKTWPKLWALAETLFAASVGAMLLHSLVMSHTLTPLVNVRFAAFALAWLVAALARQVDGESQARRGDWWLLAILLLPLWASTQELWNAFATYHAVFGNEWQHFASLGVSLWWSLFATLCLIAGIARREQSLRIGALALGALAVSKVFLLDLSFLDSSLRVLSLGGLGAALLFISWLYSRFGRPEKEATA